MRALSAATLRVNASLDLTAVLQEVIDSARALTGARYGIVTTVDEAGQVQDYVSSGITPEEHRRLAEWPDAPRLLGTPPQLGRAVATRKPARLCSFAWLLLRTDNIKDPPGHADAVP